MSRRRVDQRMDDIFIQSPTGTPLFRHQSSMEGVIDFATQKLLEPDERSSATDIFNQIVAQYEPSQTTRQGYKRVTLLRLTYESVVSRDNFLSCFFLFIETELLQGEDVSQLSLSQALTRYINLDSWNRQQRKLYETCLVTFSDYLVDNFFLPCMLHTVVTQNKSTNSDPVKASARKTPQVTPAPLSGAQTSEQMFGTAKRLSTLRRDCLIRDRHRCVISHNFDIAEGEMRVKLHGDGAEDDSGRLLKHNNEGAEYLEVAHILPHSLTSVTNRDGDLQLVCTIPILLTLIVHSY